MKNSANDKHILYSIWARINEKYLSATLAMTV